MKQTKYFAVRVVYEKQGTRDWWVGLKDIRHSIEINMPFAKVMVKKLDGVQAEKSGL